MSSPPLAASEHIGRRGAGRAGRLALGPLPLLLLLASACDGGGSSADDAANDPAPQEARQAAVADADSGASASPSEPVADPSDPQAAADVVRRYYALLEDGRYVEALQLRRDERPGAESLAAEFRDVASLRANIGAPGRIEGAAGSLYTDVPVQISGSLRDGTSFSRAGSVTLRRANDIPGSTPQQRRWRIASITFEGKAD